MRTATILKRLKAKASRVRKLRRECITEQKQLKQMVKKFPKKEIEFYAERIAGIVAGL